MASKHQTRGIPLILGGLLLLAAALSLVLWNLAEERRAAATAQAAVKALTEAIPSPLPAREPETPPEETEEPAETPAVLLVEGRDYLGILEIPALNLTLPVLADWSESALKLAPCRYQGTPEAGDLIIAGHNYRSHFGAIPRLAPGDQVIFRDLSGNEYRYEVTGQETIPGTGIEEMAAGDWDLTLFTCTLGGQNRITVRCALED